MKNQQITKGNNLIASFMGVEKSDTPFGFRYCYMTFSTQVTACLHFHESWDWLIPVIIKIEKQGCIIEMSMAANSQCRILKLEEPMFSLFAESNNPIESVFTCCMDYIKWYNCGKKVRTTR